MLYYDILSYNTMAHHARGAGQAAAEGRGDEGDEGGGELEAEGQGEEGQEGLILLLLLLLLLFLLLLLL